MQDSWTSIVTFQQVWNWRYNCWLTISSKNILKIINPLSVTNTQHPPLSYLSAWASGQRFYKEKQGRTERNNVPMSMTAKMIEAARGLFFRRRMTLSSTHWSLFFHSYRQFKSPKDWRPVLAAGLHLGEKHHDPW